MPDWEYNLTVREAYRAMYDYLARYQTRGPSDEIGGLLGALSLLPDGLPADPAQEQDFLRSVDAVLKGEARDVEMDLG